MGLYSTGIHCKNQAMQNTGICRIMGLCSTGIMFDEENMLKLN